MRILKYLLVFFFGVIAFNCVACAENAASAPAAVASVSAKSNGSFSNAQVQNIENIVHNYLIKHPQIMIEVAQVLQKQVIEEQQKRTSEIKNLIPQYSKAIFDDKALGRVVIGNDKPKIIMAIFYSYQCPNCRVVEPIIEEDMLQNKDMKFIFIPWTFEGNADIYAARNVLAAEKQGKFYKLHRILMNEPDMLTNDKIDNAAKSVGLDMERLKRDMEDKSIENGLKANFKLAQDLHLVGTPTIFVANGQLTKFSLIPGRVGEEEFQKAIKEVQ